MPDNFTYPKAVNGLPFTVLRPTGYYVDLPGGGTYADPAGHTWFTKNIARAIAIELGTFYHQGGSGTLKQVVTGYLPPTPPAAPAANPAGVQGELFALDGCTCGGIGRTGAHRGSCPWGSR